MISNKRYFGIEYGDEYYIFDSRKISKEEVLEESEYSYKIFREALTEDDILELLNENDELKKEIENLKKVTGDENIFEQLKKHKTYSKNVNFRR